MQQNNILIIKLGALGDVVQALGPMKAIRNHHPDASITALTTKPFADLMRRSGYADNIWIDTRPKWFDISGWIKLRAQLNSRSFTRVYDLQNNDRTAFYMKLFSPPPEWVGAAKGATIRNDSPLRTAGQAFDGHVQTLALAGIQDVTIDRMEWLDSDISRFNLRTPYVLIIPGSSPKRPEKRWPTSSYATLCTALSQRGLQPVLIGAADEKNIMANIIRECPDALDLSGRTDLFDIVPLARHAAGAIGNDTGPMHMIAPTGCKSVVLFSRFSNPVRHAPKGQYVATLQQDNLTDLTVDAVLKKFEEISA